MNSRVKLRLGVFVLATVLALVPASGEQLISLRNGLILRGGVAEIATLKEGFGAAGANQMQVRPIWYIDDGLRQTFVHGRGMVAVDPVDVADLERTIEFWQKKPLGGKIVKGMGSILGVSGFNEYGRRHLTIRGPEGPVQVIQGITELNSRYAKLIAVAGTPMLNWDMRIATSSLDSQTLDKIFKRRLNQNDLNSRLEAVRFYSATKRYGDAKRALQKIINDFPNENELKPLVTSLTENQAEQLLEEAETRAEAGQYELARGILSGFPTQSVGRVTRIKVQDAMQKLDDSRNQAETLVAQLRDQLKELNQGQSAALKPIVDEIENGLSPDTLSRLSDYSRLGNVATSAVDDRISLAVSGWLLGSGQGIQNLSVAISLVQVRDLVREYLGSPDAGQRKSILETLRNLEGAVPEYVDRMLPLIVPPLEFPQESENESVDGMFAIDTGKSQYLIQLPPEYNPLREYPCVLALHESRSTPQSQLDWWAGAYSEATKVRRGHGTRQGFIVVAPVWSRSGQRVYEYTPQEHQRVLAALRDAMRRTSIDSDRVFITGHGEGATAAWDIALAHPDLWAGMISISGAPSKTVPHYEPNSHHVPLYMVMGEFDGSKADGAIINDYMSFDHDAMVVMYRGRGREYFYDEIHRLFEWMKLSSHRRREIPSDIEVSTMRTGDQFFWWLELGDLKPDVSINPILWDEAKRIRAGKVSASIGNDNQIRVRGPSESFRVLLRPQPGIDLTKEVVIRTGASRTTRLQFEGSLETMLEDARVRADRKRPFWITASIP